MSPSILVINAGSSSLKFALYDAELDRPGALRLRGEVSGIGSSALRFSARDEAGRPIHDGPRLYGVDPASHDAALEAVMTWIHDGAAAADLVAVGHRIVHGGDLYDDAVRIDAQVLDQLAALVPLARLHQPFGLAGVRAIRNQQPALLQVGCFDTAFHRTLPDVARRYALPRALTESGIRRYGFHGLSYAHLANELAGEMGDDFATSRVVAAHLGSGSSLCAMRGGRSLATTMGFTPLDGLVMGTRPGSIDPGILLYLLQERGMSVDALSRMLHRECGLLGISGTTADMQRLLESDAPAAQDAVESYVHAIMKEIGALATCLGGLDAIAFTAGIGERAAPIRASIVRALEWFGVRLDPQANAAHARRIEASDSRVRIFVIPTDEEGIIARETVRVLKSQAG
jgi:acetate kinase